MVPAAVIFDMDGLLIDSEPIWASAGKALLIEYGITLSQAQYEESIGLRTSEWLDYWFSYFGFQTYDKLAAENWITDTVIREVQLHGMPLPGACETILFFKEKGLPIGLATSSPLRLANVVIDVLGLHGLFDAIQSAEHLAYGKPHPEVYQLCAAQIKAQPIHCLCFEDSFNGLIAAKAARMKVIAVPAANTYAEGKWAAADGKLFSLLECNDTFINSI